jgi:hypothetical protein
MAGNQYVSSVGYAAVPVWTASATLAVGAFRRQVAPAAGNERVFRVSSITTGVTGGSEPAWNITVGATTADGGVTWTEVTGNPTYNWSAPHRCIQNAVASGWGSTNNCIIYVASNHNYTVAAGFVDWSGASLTLGAMRYFLSVNPAGSVPPVAADLQAGAKETLTGSSGFQVRRNSYIDGLSVKAGSGAVNTNINVFDNSQSTFGTWRNGTLELGGTAAGNAIVIGHNTTNSAETYRFENMTFRFAATDQTISVQGGTFSFDNCTTAGSVPAVLIQPTFGPMTIFMRGCDWSAITGSLMSLFNQTSNYQIMDCRLNAAVTVATYNNTTNGVAVVDVINSNSGAVNYDRQRWMIQGKQTVELVNVRSGGASNGATAFSWKVAVNNTPDLYAPFANPFLAPPIEIWNTSLTPITVTLNILSSTTLKDNEAGFDLYYPGSAATPLATIASTIPNALAPGANLTSGSFGWNTSGVGTPVQQQCSVTVTPAMAGMLRLQPKVLKASQTVWIDPAPVVT